MKPLKLGFSDTFSTAINFFTEALGKRFQIVRDDVNPEYLIYGEGVYGQNHRRFGPEVTKIFYTGENQRPSDYRCDFAISFDHPTSDRMFRLPLYLIYEFDHKICRNKEMRKGDDYNNKKFCSFVVKNPGCKYRNDYFEILSRYKKVDSAGPLFNNMNGCCPSSVIEKVKFMSNYRFNLCFENSSHPGYCTEKLFEALCAKTVPIYWGSPTAALDFNPAAFINRYNFASDQQFIDFIIQVNSNKELYNHYYLQPMFRDEEFFRTFNIDHFLDWFQQNVYQGVINK